MDWWPDSGIGSDRVALILGIGNPGSEYAATRHNAGFLVVDELARRWGLTVDRKQWHGLAARHGPTWLLKPQTYVNRSGHSAQAAMSFLKLRPEALLVVVDDIHLALGTLRLRGSGSDGGHNGLKDIGARIGWNFARLRLGIGAPAGHGQVAHVLGRFDESERDDATAMVAKAADCCERFVTEGLEAAMRFNGPLRPPPAKPKPKPAPVEEATDSARRDPDTEGSDGSLERD